MEMGGSDFDNSHEKSVECGDFERRNSTAKQHSLPRHNKQNSSFTAGETILLFTFKTNSNCFKFLNLDFHIWPIHLAAVSLFNITFVCLYKFYMNFVY